MRPRQEAAPVPIETLCQDMGGIDILKLDPRPATGEHGGLLVDFKDLDDKGGIKRKVVELTVSPEEFQQVRTRNRALSYLSVPK